MRLIDADALIESIKAQAGMLNWMLPEADEITDILSKGFIEQVNKMPTVPQWIPCSERLPENDDIVLITMDDSITVRGEFIEQLSNELGFFKDGAWHWAYESGQDYWPETTHVTAWMPLPESYKGE